jgi:hypothetical protein
MTLKELITDLQAAAIEFGDDTEVVMNGPFGYWEIDNVAHDAIEQAVILE